MSNREQVLRPLRARSYEGPKTRSYPNFKLEQQAQKMADTVNKARKAGNLKRRVSRGR
jgi:hypothetical protein